MHQTEEDAHQFTKQ
jgi:hypothetical protein